jgi:signal transduction histidine kinase
MNERASEYVASPEDVGPNSVRDMTPEEMVSLIAHEIRNHLAVIQGFGHELGNSWERISEETKRSSVRRMTDRARYLNMVVSNLMYMRRIQEGELFDCDTAISVEWIFERLGDEFAELAGGAPVQFEKPDGLSPLCGDPQLLRQILTNLIVNASRFSPRGSPIHLGVRDRDGMICIEVRDHGPGIPEELRPEIFKKFRRLEEGGTGVGLGLFISRELARSMGGDLWVEDPDDGPGSRFVCRLPKVTH